MKEIFRKMCDLLSTHKGAKLFEEEGATTSRSIDNYSYWILYICICEKYACVRTVGDTLSN